MPMPKPIKISILVFLLASAILAAIRPAFAQAQPTPIECGKAVAGSIDIAGEKDVYSFNASKGDSISIFVFKISGNPLVYLEFYDPNGVNIASGLDRIDKKVTFDGAYRIIVKDKNDKRTGEYSLIWQKMNNPCANSLSYGQPAQGLITKNERVKFYSFRVSANDFIILRAATVSGNMDAYLELYAPDGISLAKSAAQIDKKLLIDGIYTVIIRDEYDDETGDYVLNCEKINDSPDAVDISFGDTITGRFNSFNETNIYKFTADANDKVYIVFYPITVRFNSSVPLLELYDSTGAKLTAYNFSRGRILHIDIPSAGTTYLLITNNSAAVIGGYEFTIQRKNNPAHSSELKYDSIMNGSIDSPAQINVYRLTANANDTISLCSDSKDFSPYLELYDADGLPVYESFEQPQHIFRFSKSGLSYLFITDTYTLKGGVYNFILLKGDIACSGIDLVGPKVLVKTPNKGEVIEGGSEFTIWWDYSDNTGIVSQEIALSTDSGRTYAAIASGLERNNAYVWRVPANLNTTQARIKVVARDAQGNIGEDQSDTDFSILNTALPPGAKDAGYEYDRLNRLIVSSVNTVKSAEYSYDASGNRLTLIAYENQQQPKPANLIFNPDMEQGVSSPTGWYTVGATGSNIRAIWAADYAYSPIHSLKITNTSALAVSLGTLMGWQGRPVNFSAPYPRTINLSGWAKASGLRLFTDGYAALKLNIVFSDNTTQVYYLRFISGSYNWRKAQVRQTFNKTIKSIRPQLVLYKAQGTVWFDDISIAP